MANNKSVKKMTATASFVQATDAASGTGAKTIADTMSIPIGATVTACITVPSIASNSSGNSETIAISLIIENGGTGGSTAAPIALKLIKSYFQVGDATLAADL